MFMFVCPSYNDEAMPDINIDIDWIPVSYAATVFLKIYMDRVIKENTLKPIY